MGKTARLVAVQRLAIVAGVLLLPGCGGSSKPEPYTSEAGNFRVVIAGKPKESQQTLQSPVGPLKMFTFETQDRNKTNRGVVYSDYPMEVVQAGDPTAMLDGSVQGMITSGKLTLQSQQPITLDGHPGREVRFEVNPPAVSEKGTGRARIYLVGNRLYQAIMVGPASKVSEEDLDNFVKSFELLRKVPGIERDAPILPVAGNPQHGRPAPTAKAAPPVASPARPSRVPAPIFAGDGKQVVQVGDAGPDPSNPAEVAIEVKETSGALSDRPEANGNERERFREVAPERGVLVGVRVGYVDAFGGSKVGAIQPIFQLGSAYIDGKVYGKEIPLSVRLVARPGYAVGAINTHTGLLLDAFQLVFMRFKDGRLDPEDSYLSDWLGDPRGGGPASASGEGKVVVGLHGRNNGREVNALGLVVAE